MRRRFSSSAHTLNLSRVCQKTFEHCTQQGKKCHSNIFDFVSVTAALESVRYHFIATQKYKHMEINRRYYTNWDAEAFSILESGGSTHLCMCMCMQSIRSLPAFLSCPLRCSLRQWWPRHVQRRLPTTNAVLTSNETMQEQIEMVLSKL